MSDRMFHKQYIKNIVDYFKGKNAEEFHNYVKKIEKMDNKEKSGFEYQAYKLYEMVVNNAPEDELYKKVDELQKVPITYFQLRTFFG